MHIANYILGREKSSVKTFKQRFCIKQELEGIVLLKGTYSTKTVCLYFYRELPSSKTKMQDFQKNISFWGTFLFPPFWRKKGLFLATPICLPMICNKARKTSIICLLTKKNFFKTKLVQQQHRARSQQMAAKK